MGRLTVQKQQNLTEVEKEILILLTIDFLTPKEIALRRNTSVKAVYKVQTKLKKYGVLSRQNVSNFPKEIEVEKKGGVSPAKVKSEHPIRLHAEQYHITIIKSTTIYNNLTKKGTYRLSIEGNTVMCYKNTIEIYSNSSFFGVTPNVSDSKAMNYWSRFLMKLENRLNILILKDGYCNISRVRAEYAETGNEFAKQTLKENQKINIVDENGKSWLIVDDSFKFKECETVHPKNSKEDMQLVVQPFFNDLREKVSLLPSQLTASIESNNKQIYEIATGLNNLIKLVNTFVQTQTINNSYDFTDVNATDINDIDYLG